MYLPMADTVANYSSGSIGKTKVISVFLSAKEFKVTPKRWIVERTFAWFGHQRRLAKDL
jgi:transposase